MRPISESIQSVCLRVSIHAPREGCDTQEIKDYQEAIKFQFTHPGRGATYPKVTTIACRGCFNSRTPGGVRLSLANPAFNLVEFQFTHPGRGATLIYRPKQRISQFQFTHPGRGATRESGSTIGTPSVSIHAPREGCDRRRCIVAISPTGFNSRTPGGVRLFSILAGVINFVFQFTHPGRGATVWCKVAYYGADKQA